MIFYFCDIQLISVGIIFGVHTIIHIPDSVILLRLSDFWFYNRLPYHDCLVYSISEDLMKKVFNSYGSIQEIRVFKDKGYAFIR